MTLSSTNRAAIAIAIILLIGAATLGIYFYREHKPLPPVTGTASRETPDLLSQLPADGPAVGFVDVVALRSLQNSPLAAVLGLTSPGPQADRDYAEFVRQTGFDYTRDLDKAAVAFWPQSFSVVPGGGIGDNRTLAIADGRFDEQKITAYALRTGKIDSSATPAVYEVPGNPIVWFEFLSPTRIALASGKNARDLLTQLSHASAPDSAMKARVERVAGAPIFAVARTDKLPESLYANFSNSPQLEKMVRSVRSLSLAGKPDGDIIKAGLDAECDSPKSAAEISTLLDGFRMVASMALYDPKTLRQMTAEQAAFLKAFIRQLKVTRDDRFVRLRLDITPQMLAARPSAPVAH